MSRDAVTPATPRVTYSKEEQLDIYALAKMLLETGHIKKAETILRGLATVAPDFVPAWLGLTVAQASQSNIELAYESARQALKLQTDSAAAMILLVTTALSLGDKGTAGTYLGEIGELIDQGVISEPSIVRLFKMQMVRYHAS